MSPRGSKLLYFSAQRAKGGGFSRSSDRGYVIPRRPDKNLTVRRSWRQYLLAGLFITFCHRLCLPVHKLISNPIRIVMSEWALDHIIIGGFNLDQDIEDFERALKTKPIVGGSYPTWGTRNALVGVLNSKTYIELMCPDPGKEGHLGNQMLTMHGVGLGLTPYHYAIRTNDLAGVSAKAKAMGMEPMKIQKVTRTTSTGKTLNWKVLFIRGHKLGGLVPFFVDWGSTKHPSEGLNTTSGETGASCLSAKVVVTGPKDMVATVKKLVGGTDGVEYEEHEKPGLDFIIGISGMEGGYITIKGFQPESIDFEECKTRMFTWTTF